MKKLVFLEFIDEYEAFCRQVKDPGDFSIIALEPKLQAQLKKLGVSHQNSLPYFNNDSHRSMIRSAQSAVDWLNRSFQFTDQQGFSSVYLTDLQFYVRFYLFHLMSLVEIIDNCVRQSGEVELFAALAEPRGGSLMITPADRYLGKLVKEYAAGHSLKFTNIAVTLAPAIVKSEEKASKLNWLMIGLLKAYCFLFRKKLVLIPGNGYGFAALKNKLFQHVPGLAFISPCPEKFSRSPFKYLTLFIYGIFNKHFWFDFNGGVSGGGLKDKLTTIFRGTKVFDYKGVALAPIVEGKVVGAIAPYFAELSGQLSALKSVVKELGIRLVISPFSRGFWYGAGEFSRQAGIKSLFVSHGAHPVPVDEIHEMELVELCRGFMLSEYTDVALATPVQEEHFHYFKRKYSWVKANEIKTGPLIFADLSGIEKNKAKLKLGLLPEETIITHAVSNKKRGGERYYFLETFDEYLASLSDLISTVNKLPLVHLVVRPHPGFELNDEELKRLLPRSNKITISCQGPFSEVLAATDIFVSYSSTAIDESMLNGRPVILYDKWDRYNHFKLSVYRTGEIVSPIVYTNSLMGLRSAINEYQKISAEGRFAGFDLKPYKYEANHENNLYEYVENVLNKREVPR
ncbi:MAG: hypothetical protein WCW67_02080 [Candidatus Margulisiibacteriota bacterium]|jgi:hypothetical protein